MIPADDFDLVNFVDVSVGDEVWHTSRCGWCSCHPDSPSVHDVTGWWTVETVFSGEGGILPSLEVLHEDSSTGDRVVFGRGERVKVRAL